MANYSANSFQFKQLKATTKMLRQTVPGYSVDSNDQAFVELARAQALLGAYVAR